MRTILPRFDRGNSMLWRRTAWLPELAFAGLLMNLERITFTLRNISSTSNCHVANPLPPLCHPEAQRRASDASAGAKSKDPDNASVVNAASRHFRKMYRENSLKPHGRGDFIGMFRLILSRRLPRIRST